MNKPEIDVVWFKRDFRLDDHHPLSQAITGGRPTLLIAFLEPSLMNAPQSDTRHWRFVYESVSDLNGTLSNYGHRLYLFFSEVIPVFMYLLTKYNIRSIYSHAETGLKVTHQRDIKVKEFCMSNNINWIESPYAGVIRGIKKRNNWPKHWYGTMSTPIQDPDLKHLTGLNWELPNTRSIPPEVGKSNDNFQRGGSTLAKRYLASFIGGRIGNYNKHISKPELSRRSCSRLSPYLAWGNVSMRQVYQAAMHAKGESDQKRSYNSFMSRLRWHCHFIQKFEMMDRYETENINLGYNSLRTEWQEEKYKAWEEGETGYPLIDACQKCLKETGYLNFRMRSMLVSFLTHHLWLHWKRGADFLAGRFLDFEPGIHYAQFQMQAGTTGYNTVRIYNPIKQAKDNDAEGVFVKNWLPRFRELPLLWVHEPWKMTAIEQEFYSIKLGVDYPNPVVDIKTTYRSASKALWSIKKDPIVKMEARKILAKQNEEERVAE